MLTIIADSNIAHLQDYFNATNLGVAIEVVAMAGRDIDADAVNKHQPDALLIRSVTPINEALLSANDSVKFVGSATIGTDHVDQDYLAKRGVRFANAAGSSKHSVAQYVITAVLNLRPEYWHAQNAKQPIKLGIVGLGNIGSTLAKYAHDLNWQVLGYDPFLPQSAINNASFDEVITQSDVISLHVPLTYSEGHQSKDSQSEDSQYPTYHLINTDVLNNMPNDTLLINSARGQVISESALLADLVKNELANNELANNELIKVDNAKINDVKIDGLQSKQRQVVLDVFEHEPTVPQALLSRLSIATPHIAGYTLEGKLRGTQMVFDAFIKTFNNIINVKHTELLGKLLPDNPYHWQDLLKEDPAIASKKLSQFYDIKADDRLLRRVIDRDAGQVQAQAFDNLRKTYELRREWID